MLSAKKQAEVENQAESTIFQAEKLIRDYKEKLPEDAVKQTEEKIEAVRKAQAGQQHRRNQSSGQKRWHNSCSRSVRRCMKMLRHPQGAGADADGADNQAKADDDEDVIDAEYTET